MRFNGHLGFAVLGEQSTEIFHWYYWVMTSNTNMANYQKGGNDLLYNISFLQTTSKLSKVMGKGAMIGKWGLKELNPSRNKVFEETYFEIIKPFKKQYETIVANLSNHRANLLLCTVYEGDLVDSDEFSDVSNSSKTMVSIFNDIVYRVANKFNADVLELRDIFTSSDDYANQIEPSHIGGEKLAQSIVRWIWST